MAGNSRSGRKPPQIDARRRLDPNDVPAMPGDLQGHGRAYWASTIATAQHLTSADSTLAAECCRLYDLYRRAVHACESIPLDDVAAKTAGKYYDRWVVAAKLLCLDVLGRQRSQGEVRRDGKEEAVDKESQMFGVVG